MAQRSGRAPWTPAALVVLLLLAGVGSVVWLEARVRQHRTATRAGEAQAQAELDRRARRYADRVLATGDVAPDDNRLVALGQEVGVQVWDIDRVPDLSTVVHGTQRYAPWPGSVTRCHRITFRHLGAPSAVAQVEVLPTCPAITALPTHTDPVPGRTAR